MSSSRRFWALAAPLAAACAFAASASAQSACGWSGYSYAGIRATAPAYGIAAKLTAVRAPNVQNGHVAAWVGVGGSGVGPGGKDEWLQVGLASFPGGPSELYYELTQPGYAPKYVRLLRSVSVGSSHSVAVLEMAKRPNVWRVWVDGRAASKPLFLPRSHGKWAPVATTETWDGGVPSCNGFAYRFDTVKLAGRAGGGWSNLVRGQWLQDPGYRVLSRRSVSSFLAGRA